MKNIFGFAKPSPKYFDLNIDKILENWECKHAVREIIANALDEQILTNTQDIKIFKEQTTWIIKDFGRGLKPEHLTQDENEEKLNTSGVIGKFGIGLKDALATFDRHNIKVTIYSKYANISIIRTAKNGFDEIITLHARVAPPTKDMIGTEFHISGLSDADMESAQRLFLKFGDHQILESTSYGDVVKSKENEGSIYINGVLVANEPNFLFSYNIKRIDSLLKKALNRERSNVGRTAYASVIRKILVNCESDAICESLSNDLANFSSGLNHDELKWIDVQEHAAKLLARKETVVFVTTNEIQEKTDLVNEAGINDRKVIVIPQNLSKKIEETNNLPENSNDNKLTTLSEFIKQRSNNFEYQYVDVSTFSQVESENFKLIDHVFRLIGGKPSHIESIRVSEKMQKDTVTFMECDGLWNTENKSIILHRRILKDKNRFLGVLLHEIAHAKSGYSDTTRGFERELTNMLGLITSQLI
ncbi:MAG: hypothetical protein K2L17_08050 [Muribaculaceae bacterium]|nr:hypothetical protein [Muribaculaceae bacterium]